MTGNRHLPAPYRIDWDDADPYGQVGPVERADIEARRRDHYLDDTFDTWCLESL